MRGFLNAGLIHVARLFDIHLLRLPRDRDIAFAHDFYVVEVLSCPAQQASCFALACDVVFQLQMVECNLCHVAPTSALLRAVRPTV